MTRWQLSFSRGERLKYVGHLDLSNAWLRAMRRANIPLAYSAGFHPHPKMAFASPLPVGVLGAAELLDLTIGSDMGARSLMERVAPQLPDGLALIGVEPLAGPPLASRVRFAEYRALVDGSVEREEIAARIGSAMEAASLPRIRQRDRSTKSYDLRPLIADLAVLPLTDIHQIERSCQRKRESSRPGNSWMPASAGRTMAKGDAPLESDSAANGSHHDLRMRLVVGNEGAGRPDEVLDALGLRDATESIERLALILEG